MPRNYVIIEGSEKLLDVLDKMPKEAESLTIEAMQNEAVDTIGRMTTQAPVDTGNLRRNIKFEPQGDDVVISSEALNDSRQDYAPHVEYGTRFTRPQPYFWHNVRQAVTNLESKLIQILNQISK